MASGEAGAIQDMVVVSAGEVRVEGAGAEGIRAEASEGTHAGTVSVAILGGGAVTATGAEVRGVHVSSAGTGVIEATLEAGAQVRAEGASAIGVEATGVASGGLARRADVQVQVGGEVEAAGEFGVGVVATSDDGQASLLVATGARVQGGWQADAGSAGSHGMAAAGVVLGSSAGASLVNAGRIGAGSDRALFDEGRGVGGTGRLTLENRGQLTGFIELAAGGQNTVQNQSGGVFELRHFADTDGDGVRDTARVAVSDFGAPGSRFDNQAGATVRLGAVQGATVVDATGYHVPTAGAAATPLPGDVYHPGQGVTQAQLVNLGEFRHAGTIDLRGAAIGNTLVITDAATPGAGAGTGVFVSDGGSLLLRAGARLGQAAYPTDRYADMLVVDGTRLGAGGPTRIHVDYDPADLGHLTQGNGIAVVEVRDATASAEGAFALGSRVAAGAYEYELHQGGVDGDAADGNWYLRSYLRLDDDTPTPPVDNEVPNYRVEVPVDMVLPALAHRLGLDTLGTYHDRAGEHYLPAGFRATPVDARGRPTQDEQRGWARVFGRSGKVGGSTASEASRYRWFEKNGPRYEFDLSGLQVGLDVHREVDEEGTREVAGGYLAVTQASAQVEAVLGGRAGKASMKGYSLGGYWTRMAASGAYVDGVLQFTDYQGVSARSVRGVEISPDGWGIAASLEAGHAFEPVAHWHFEPQVQLVYQVVSMGGTRDDFGRIRYGDAEAVYGRLGMRLVRNGETDEGQRYTFWGRFNVWQQFGGKAKTSFASLGGGNRVALGTTLGGTWAQLGLGLNAQLSRSVNGFVSADYEQNLSFDASRSIGARVGVQVTW